MRCLLALAVVCLLALPVAAVDLHVDNVAGDDAFSGRHPTVLSSGNGPLRTIGRALELAASGDRIVLAATGVPYRESISLVGSRRSGDTFEPFTIHGGGAVLDGSAPIPEFAWQHHAGGVFRFRPPTLDHQQLFLDGKPLERVDVERTAAKLPELQPLEWCLHGGFMYFKPEPRRMPADYQLAFAHQTVGITLYHVAKVQIVDLTIQGFQLDGVNAFNSAREVVLDNVICRGNGRAGVVVGGASQVNVDGCLLGDNGRAQLMTMPISVTHVRASNLIPNTAPAWLDQGGQIFFDEASSPEETASPSNSGI